MSITVPKLIGKDSGKSTIRHVMDNGILLYPYQEEDYDVRREVGKGQFSTVYEATPKYLESLSSIAGASRKRNDSVLSPPATPTRTSLDGRCHVFAIKLPVDRVSAKVCRDEARMLTQLRDMDGHEAYTVPFHGLDSRTNAIVMDLMPCSLDGFIKDQLNTLPLDQRTDIVAGSFHHMASYLLDGLKWLHAHHIIHGDIKPGNILLRPAEDPSLPPSMCYDPIYTDFSSATAPEERPPSPREAPIAGGTWDFMYFGHINGARESDEVLNDHYGLMMTLLYYVVGDGAYRSIPNRWLQMDARKQGRPVEFVMRDPELAERFQALAAREGFEGLQARMEKAFNGAWGAVLQ